MNTVEQPGKHSHDLLLTKAASVSLRLLLKEISQPVASQPLKSAVSTMEHIHIAHNQGKKQQTIHLCYTITSFLR